MNRKLGLAIVTAVAVFALLAGGCGGRAEISSLDDIREEAKALVEVQMILSWYSNCVGEKSVQTQAYKGHELLFSRGTVRHVDHLLNKAGDEERRALEFLRNYLINEHVSLQTAHYADEIVDTEAAGKVRVEGMDEEVPYRELDILLDNEEDAQKRLRLQDAQAKFWETALNPIHERKTEEEHRLCRELGYASYVALSEELRNVDLQALIQISGEFIQETDEEYQSLFANEVRSVLGIEPEEFRRSDIGRLAQISEYNRFFPKELVIPAFRDFLENIGLDMNSAAGRPIHVNNDNHPLKDPRAVCYPIEVPDDVRISVKPSGGAPDFETFFHEGGHAVHFANATTDVWEFQQLGNNTVTEAYSGLFENLWGNPDWLRSYREYVRDYNRFVNEGDEVPLMSDEEIARLVRNRAFWDLYFVRRYAGAKLVYETVLHGGAPAIYEGFYDGSAGDDMQEVYRILFSDAYGFELTPTEALRFRTDVDPFFYSADYSRSYALAKQLHEGLSKRFGDPWWRSHEAGAFLRDELWPTGNKLQGDEVSRMLGYDAIDWEAFGREQRARLDFVRSILGS